jgi:hypothetical protein
MWGFSAKMVFLVPGVYSSVTLETVSDDDYAAYLRMKNERERQTDAARAAWERFISEQTPEVI